MVSIERILFALRLSSASNKSRDNLCIPSSALDQTIPQADHPLCMAGDVLIMSDDYQGQPSILVQAQEHLHDLLTRVSGCSSLTVLLTDFMMIVSAVRSTMVTSCAVLSWSTLTFKFFIFYFVDLVGIAFDGLNIGIFLLQKSEAHVIP